MRRLRSVLPAGSMVLYSVYTLYPIYRLFIGSFKPYTEIFQLQPTFFPHDPTLVNCLKVIRGEGIGVDFLRSPRAHDAGHLRALWG